MRLPFYRSLVFQLSLPVLLFMLWAWRDSGTFSSKLFFCSGGKAYGIGQYQGAIEILQGPLHGKKTTHISVIRNPYQQQHYEMYAIIRGFLFPKAIKVINDSLGVKGVRIAHWLIFVISLISTVAFLIQRHYRKWH